MCCRRIHFELLFFVKIYQNHALLARLCWQNRTREIRKLVGAAREKYYFLVKIDGKVAATGTFSFGHAQESQLSVGHTAPAAPQGPDDTPSYFPPALKRPPVRFFVNFEVKLIEGSLPFSGADRGYVRIWARHRDPAMWGTLEGLIAIGDVLPPAAFPMMTRPGPNSSMNWIINLLSDHANTRDGWYMMETQLTAGNGGYSSQVMRVWNTDGDMVADGMQSVIIFA